MVFDIHRENVYGKVMKAREKMRQEEQIYKKNVQKVKEVFHKTVKIDNMTIKLIIICKQFKRKVDDKMPNKKEE